LLRELLTHPQQLERKLISSTLLRASPNLGWVMDLDRGVEIVVDVACLGLKVGNGYGYKDKK
jgi:hypothetical protein